MARLRLKFNGIYHITRRCFEVNKPHKSYPPPSPPLRAPLGRPLVRVSRVQRMEGRELFFFTLEQNQQRATRWVIDIL